MRWSIVGLALAALLLPACPTDPDLGDPFFPDDYLSSYTQVRDCRSSTDHDLHKIRVLTDPAALAPYQERLEPFPPGAIVLKEEHDFADSDCSGDIVVWTVMQKLEAGASSDTLDWSWQKVDADRTVTELDKPGCFGCHSDCTPETDGYDYTCTVP
jgi:hypothetical protein